MRVMFGVLLVALVASTGQARHFEGAVMDDWESFKFSYNKVYLDDAEENFRMRVFGDNKEIIAQHNQLYARGISSFTMKMNQFGDMLSHEIVSIMNGYSELEHNVKGVNFMEPDEDVVMPDTVDWRQKGAVTPVKDQKQCGSCWAFSATGSLEGQHFRETGELVSLSEQNLVDCSTKYGNHGCGGGLMDFAYAYIKDNQGIDTEDSYPYLAINGVCNFNKLNVGANDTGYVDIESKNERALKKAVATVGPISVAIDAALSTFHFYHSGVYSDLHCSQVALDHGVLAVGYGTDENDQDYWLVKNSWNETWGDQGYIKMARNQDNMCGIATQASYPLV